jgi:hypothetical protein
MTKLLALIATLGIGALVFFGVLSFQDKSRIEELERSPDRGKVHWHAELAKAKGKQNVHLPPSKVYYVVPRNWDDALANFHLIIAEPIDSQSYATTYDIQTWYKFRLIEELSVPTVDCTGCATAIDPPVDLLPLQANEFLTAKIGGETSVDGITISSSDPTFPNFETGKRYMLLVVFDSNKTVGLLRSGPWGTFALESDEKLKPVNAELKHPFREKLSEQFGNSLAGLRRSLKTRK